MFKEGCKSGVLISQTNKAKSKNRVSNRSELESSARAGDSPVGERNFIFVIPFLK